MNVAQKYDYEWEKNAIHVYDNNETFEKESFAWLWYMRYYGWLQCCERVIHTPSSALLECQ